MIHFVDSGPLKNICCLARAKENKRTERQFGIDIPTLCCCKRDTASIMAFMTFSKKRFYALVVMALLSLHATDVEASGYNGIGGHQYEGAMTALKSEGIMRGYPDGQFRPNMVVSRAEFLKIVLLSHHIEAGRQYCFPDVQDQWFAEWVCAAAEEGIVAGYPDGLFHPERTVSFAEAAKILERVSAHSVTESSPWYKGFIEFLASKQAIPPSISGFDHLVTRGEAAAMVWLLRGSEQPYEDMSPEEQSWAGNRQQLKEQSLDYQTMLEFNPSTHVLNFTAKGKKIVLSGTRVNVLCTPTFPTIEASEAALAEAMRNGTYDTYVHSFYQQHCPRAAAFHNGQPEYFPYLSDRRAFIGPNPGGFEELLLMTDAEIRAYEQELTQPITSNGTARTWTECRTEQRLLAEGLHAKALTCTGYHQEEASDATTDGLIPNTHCFVPVSQSLYFAFRIPLSGMDAGEDGCSKLRSWGIRSVQLK